MIAERKLSVNSVANSRSKVGVNLSLLFEKAIMKTLGTVMTLLLVKNDLRSENHPLCFERITEIQ